MLASLSQLPYLCVMFNKLNNVRYGSWKSHATLTPLAKQDCPPLATI